MEVNNFLDLPNGVLMDIFEYLSYDEISKKRLVCRRIDEICQELLNRGFTKVMRQHSQCAKRIKALLPRRESERRNHCLSRHADILTSIETRISMLSMTYTKYIDLNLCCFIPGKILDEIFGILRLIEKTNKPLRPHEVLQELRDISSMAIEHFDEKISNTLKKSIGVGTKICNNSLDNNGRNSTTQCGSLDFDICSSNKSGSSSSSSSLGNWNGITNRAMQHRCLEIMRQSVNNLLNFKPLDDNNKTDADLFDFDINGRTNKNEQQTIKHKECLEARSAMMYVKNLQTEYKKGIIKMHRMQQIQNHHARRLQLSLAAIAHQNLQIGDLKKKYEDLDAKNRELSANIKQMNVGNGNGGNADVNTAAVTIDSVAATAATSKINDTTSLLMVEPLEIVKETELINKTLLPSVRKRLHEEIDTNNSNTTSSAVNVDWLETNKKQKT